MANPYYVRREYPNYSNMLFGPLLGAMKMSQDERMDKRKIGLEEKKFDYLKHRNEIEDQQRQEDVVYRQDLLGVQKGTLEENRRRGAAEAALQPFHKREVPYSWWTDKRMAVESSPTGPVFKKYLEEMDEKVSKGEYQTTLDLYYGVKEDWQVNHTKNVKSMQEHYAKNMKESGGAWARTEEGQTFIAAMDAMAKDKEGKFLNSIFGRTLESRDLEVQDQESAIAYRKAQAGASEAAMQGHLLDNQRGVKQNIFATPSGEIIAVDPYSAKAKTVMQGKGKPPKDKSIKDEETIADLYNYVFTPSEDDEEPWKNPANKAYVDMINKNSGKSSKILWFGEEIGFKEITKKQFEKMVDDTVKEYGDTRENVIRNFLGY